MSHPFLSTHPDIAADAYCVFGLATCFVRQEGEVQDIQVIEPIPSAALETLAKGIPTSYQYVWALPIATFITAEGTVQVPAEFPNEAVLCEAFVDRALAATRTYQQKAAAMTIVPLGTKKDDFNYSTERKRVLNMENLVSTEDNVKQHAYTHQVL
jgi:hypothetical protein